MKFSFAPLVLITALFTTAFSAPTERALSKRYLDFDLSFLNGPISVRSAEPAVDEYRLSKRSVIISFSLAGLNVGVALKRGTEREELSKRNEEYNLVVTSLPPLSAHSRRSSDEYEGRHVVASIPDSMVQALQEMGVSQDKIPEYISKTVFATDPATGEQYQLVPDTDYTPSADDIVLDMLYEPTA